MRSRAGEKHAISPSELGALVPSRPSEAVDIGLGGCHENDCFGHGRATFRCDLCERFIFAPERETRSMGESTLENQEGCQESPGYLVVAFYCLPFKRPRDAPRVFAPSNHKKQPFVRSTWPKNIDGTSTRTPRGCPVSKLKFFFQARACSCTRSRVGPRPTSSGIGFRSFQPKD